jgi:hypothetical protein
VLVDGLLEDEAGLSLLGVVLLNGGLVAETHRPTLAQQVSEQANIWLCL